MNDLQKTIFSLHLKKNTGKLVIVKDDIKKEIFFKKGQPIYVDSNARSEALGQILLAEGKITSEQLNAVLERMMSSGKKQGECLVEMGLLSAYEVYQCLEQQMDKKFQNCFLIEDGGMEFFDGEAHIRDIPEFRIDVFHAMLDFFSFNVDPEKLLQISEDKTFKLSPVGQAYLADVRLLPQEAKIVRLLDGKKTLEQIQEMAEGDPDFTSLFMFVLMGLKFVDSTDVRKNTPSEPPDAQARSTVVIKDEAVDEKKNQASPIYAWALKLGKPLQDILDIKPTTPKIQIQRSYERIVKDLHLDHIETHYQGKEQEVAQSVLDRLSMALAIFSNDALIKMYMQSQSNKGKEVPSKILAEMSVQKSKVHLAAKDFNKAEREISIAIEKDPKEPSYHVMMADCLIKKASHEKTDFAKAIVEHLKKAIEIDVNFFDAYFELAMLHKLNKDLEKARDYYSKCLELKPNHPQANSELRLINKRLAEGKKPSGALFGGLFNKKKDDKK